MIKHILTNLSRPIRSGSSISRRISAVRGWCSHMDPSMNITPFFSHASSILSSSSMQSAAGFSISTCFPFAAAATAHATCWLVGSGTYTASTDLSSRTASYGDRTLTDDERRRADDNEVANRRALSRERLEMQEMVAVSEGRRETARQNL